MPSFHQFAAGFAPALASGLFASLIAFGQLFLAGPAAAQLIITGNDNQALLVDGKLQIDPDGKQSVSIIEFGIYGPQLGATVELPNSIFGPPTNLAITPDETLALVAEAVILDRSASPPKFVPSDKVHVIDLKAHPPRIVDPD